MFTKDEWEAYAAIVAVITTLAVVGRWIFTRSFWKKYPLPVKIGIALVSVLAVAGLFVFLTPLLLKPSPPEAAQAEAAAPGIEALPTAKPTAASLTSTAQLTTAPTAAEAPMQVLSGSLPEYRPVEALVDRVLYVQVPASQYAGADVPDFWIMAYEVTNAEFAAFLNSANPANRCPGGGDCFSRQAAGARIRQEEGRWSAAAGYEDHPATHVTWAGAREYCAWKQGRLPYALEFYLAAAWHPISGELRGYPWGFAAADTDSPERANYGRPQGGTAPVGSYPGGASVTGAYDLSGNVWEFSGEEGSLRYLLGGGWDSSAEEIRQQAGAMYQRPANVSGNSIGFRCVRD